MRDRGDDFSKRTKDSWEDKITPSEAKFKQILMNRYGKKKDEIIHGSSGYLDFMLSYGNKLLFFETKPASRERKQTHLNRRQEKIIETL